nr:hypothetical protein BaRGS_013058 [Batillaria attramentaria]
MFIHPPLFAFLDGVYGLPGAFLLSGAVGFERRRGQTSGGDSALAGVLHVLCGDWRDRLSVLTDRALLLFLLSVFIMSVSYHSLMVMLPTFVIRLSDLTPLEASFAISMTGVGSLFSRLVSGVIAQDPRVGRLLVYCGLLGVETLVSLLAPSLLTSGQIGVYTYCLLVGLYTGGVIILINPVVVDVVGLKKSATAFGFALFTMGVGGILGPPLIGRARVPFLRWI